jgi:hypothetical protein
VGLVHFDKARQELAIANTIDEVKEIRDRALAYRAYVKQIGESLEMQNMIAEIKIRAERKVGELLKEQEKNDGGKPMQKSYLSYDTTGMIEQPKTLKEIGISRDQSSCNLVASFDNVKSVRFPMQKLYQSNDTTGMIEQPKTLKDLPENFTIKQFKGDRKG